MAYYFSQGEGATEPIIPPTLYTEPTPSSEVLREPSPPAPAPATFTRSPEVLRETVSRGPAVQPASPLGWLVVGGAVLFLLTRR